MAQHNQCECDPKVSGAIPKDELVMMQATLRLPDTTCSCELYSRYLNRDSATKLSSLQTPSLAPFLGVLHEAFSAFSVYLVGEL